MLPQGHYSNLLAMTNNILHVGRESYQFLIESIRDYAIFIVDPKGFVVYWNKGAEEIKGYSSDEIIGQHISIFYLKEENDTGEPHRNMQMAMELGQLEEEAWRVRKDGSTFWADIMITPLRNVLELHGLDSNSKLLSSAVRQPF